MSFHSAKNDREKVDAWLGASKGLVDIIIGTRSSVFLPMKKLGIIVVDEEHDLSFKQMDKFRYSARDMALYRAKLEKIPVVLASATPSLETLKNAKDAKFETLRLNKRATGASLPNINAIDLRGKELNEGMSNHLLEATKSELDKGNQIKEKEESEKSDISWGNQIRSYVLHPYKLIKDLRSGYETSNVNDVLDGKIDKFLENSLTL